MSLRKKKDSSISVAVDLAKTGEVDAIVTAGNTGAAVAAVRLDLLLLVPAFHAPLKPSSPASSVDHRIAMLQFLANSVSNARIDTAEIDKRRTVSTLETVEQIRSGHGAAEYHLIIGGDQAAQFERWDNWQQLLTVVNVIWFTRYGYSPSPVLAGKGMEIAMDENVSSKTVRDMIKSGKDASGLVMPEVLNYIAQEGLYL